MMQQLKVCDYSHCVIDVMIGSVNTDTIQEMISQDDDRSAQQSEQGHNKEQGAASTEQHVHVTEVTAQSSGNETTHSSQNKGIF